MSFLSFTVLPASPYQLWTEASNLRHCPEALWFLFHTMAMSPAAETLWISAPAIEVAPGCRERRLTMRNLMQVGDKRITPSIPCFCH